MSTATARAAVWRKLLADGMLPSEIRLIPPDVLNAWAAAYEPDPAPAPAAAEPAPTLVVGLNHYTGDGPTMVTRASEYLRRHKPGWWT